MESSKQKINNLIWIADSLPEDAFSRTLRDGIGYYLDEKLVLVLNESNRSTEHKGRSYSFQLWYGCFFPIEKIKQSTVIGKFPFLENHPAKKEWLYIPAENENFEEEVQLVLREIIKRNPLFGLVVKASTVSLKAQKNYELDFAKPSLFNTDDPQKAKRDVIVKALTTTVIVSKEKIKLPEKIKKIKADKKTENEFLLSVLKRRG